MKRPTISLCMFARDEAATIREAIESVRPLCDEIVIGIDITARIRSKRWNVLEPWDAEFEIDNFIDRLPRRLKNDRKIRKEFDIKVSNLMGRRVNDRQLEEATLVVNVRENPPLQ